MTLSLFLALVASVPGPQSPRPQDAFSFQPDGAAGRPAGDRLAGFVGYRNSPRLAQACEDAGTGDGLYRRSVGMHAPDEVRWLGEDFLTARSFGRRLWLNVVGTPQNLSPHPNETGNSYATGLPEFARYPPTDARAWADLVLAFIGDLERDYGVVPDYVEVWNEPDRVEWFTGSPGEFLAFYAAAAARIKAQRPGILIGGPGLAGVTSTLGLEHSFLWAVVSGAAASGAPLDFASWHHYAPANELHATGAVAALKSLARAAGIGPMACIVSEWNIYPSAQGAAGVEFDRSHAAANFAGFITSAYELDLDGNLYFQDLDETDDLGITDLAGKGLGALTLHGIKKPVFRLAEFLYPMAAEDILPVSSPAQEMSMRLFATRAGNRVRLVVSNDAIEPRWVFAFRARENGMEPGWLFPVWITAGGTQATVASLMQAGLSFGQATAVLNFMPQVFAASRYETAPREALIDLLGSAPFTLGAAWRFDEAHNAPAEHLAALAPWLDLAERAAQRAAAAATASFLTALGYPYTTQELLAITIDFLDWAAQEGIPYGYAVDALKLMRDTLRDERLAYVAPINALPETALSAETAAAAGVVLYGRRLSVMLQPNSVTVLDLNL